MDELRFFLRGEIDLANVNDVAMRLFRASVVHRGDVIVDCMDLEFIDVGGFGMLEALARDFADQRRALRVAYPTPMLRRMIELFGAGDLVVEPTRVSVVADEPAAAAVSALHRLSPAGRSRAP